MWEYLELTLIATGSYLRVLSKKRVLNVFISKKYFIGYCANTDVTKINEEAIARSQRR